MTAKRTVPVTMLTGFLGAGKTTLLNRILTGNHGRRYGVIVNEFGEVGIDNDLVVNGGEKIFEMSNGCICCTIRGDLIRIVKDLAQRPGRLDGILIETTGLADPGSVARTFFVDDDIRKATRLDAIVTVVDAMHLCDALTDADVAREQIAFADVIVLNKTDLVTPDEAAAARIRIRAINPVAIIRDAERCEVDLADVLGLDAFSLDRILDVEPDFPAGVHGHAHGHAHGDQVSSLSLVADRPLEPNMFLNWIVTIVQSLGADILRMKGIVSFPDDPDRFVVQSVHMLMEGDHQRPWRRTETRLSRLVFIGRNLPEQMLRAGFESCFVGKAQLS